MTAFAEAAGVISKALVARFGTPAVELDSDHHRLGREALHALEEGGYVWAPGSWDSLAKQLDAERAKKAALAAERAALVGAVREVVLAGNGLSPSESSVLRWEDAVAALPPEARP